MNAIVAVDRNWAIGKDGDLLVHLPGDLKYYRQKTIGNVIIAGRKTLESFPGGRPLPERTNIVVTRNRDFEAEGCVVCHSKEQVLESLEAYGDAEVFVAGGAEIYELFMDESDAFYETKIDSEFDADRFFPNLDALGYRVECESPVQEEKGLTYRFLKYSRD